MVYALMAFRFDDFTYEKFKTWPDIGIHLVSGRNKAAEAAVKASSTWQAA
jgi:hypothetical protein